jgi:hypothetical protein
MIGAGPTFLLPTNTDRSLGVDKWGAGPTGAIVWTPGKWVVGALVNNIWSFASDSSDPDVNQFLLQHFVNYNRTFGQAHNSNYLGFNGKRAIQPAANLAQTIEQSFR